MRGKWSVARQVTRLSCTPVVDRPESGTYTHVMDLREPIDVRLRALHDISMELSREPDFGSLCRRAVELCISRLGFDRIGIWFLDPEDEGIVVGSWGTDEAGRPRDERGIRLPRYMKDHPKELYDGSVPFLIVSADVVFNDKQNPVGRSDKAIAPLWDGTKIIGEIVADNLLSARPIEEEDAEVLVLFARTVAHLCVLKRNEAALKEALDAKTFLLEELRHRTMNSFALMRSLVSIEKGRMPDSPSKEALKTIEDRIQVLSLIFRQLDSSSEIAKVMLDDYLRRIAVDLFDGYGAETRGLSLVCRLESVEIDTKRAVSLGLIVNELVTDSLKHAFPDGRRGVVALSLRREGGFAVLAISDDGVGLPEDFELRAAKNGGFTIVRTLCAGMAGTFTIASESGARFTLRFLL
jgi:two-component sensor histidine kinase